MASKLANVTLDLIDVPSKVSFEVKWPVVIDTVVPESIIKDELENDVTLILEGKGFFPHTYLGFTSYPEVSVFDTKGTTSTDDDTEVYEAKETTNLQVNSEGSAIDFLLIDKEKVKTAIGPLKVYVEVSDAKPSIDITFSDGLSLTSLKPNTAFSGTEIEINGAGFSTQNIDNTVTFLGKTGRIQATVVSSSSNKLVVKVPQDVKTGDVNVKVKSVQAKNALLFTNRESGATVRFGDNGNLKDDIFTLTFNGASKQISLGQRKEEIFTSLIPGDYR